MSRLTRLANYARQALGLASRASGSSEPRQSMSRPSMWEQSRSGAPPVQSTTPPVQFPGNYQGPVIAPPIVPEGPPQWPQGPTRPESRLPHPPARRPEPFTDVEILGRDASYDRGDMAEIMARSRRVQSSNVYSYYYEVESGSNGILYVTFLHWEPGMASSERSGAGPTYAYYDVPLSVWRSFDREASGESAGRAVWDYLRVRGTTYGHHFRYRLIQESGGYVPRKATHKGFKRRVMVHSQRHGLGTRRAGQRRYIESALSERTFAGRTGSPPPSHVGYRGAPNRGTPNNGRP